MTNGNTSVNCHSFHKKDKLDIYAKYTPSLIQNGLEFWVCKKFLVLKIIKTVQNQN
jgi:hypothetical protein